MKKFLSLCFAASALAQHPSAIKYTGNAELWVLDQADTSSSGGGVLYVTDLNGEIERTIDLNALTGGAGCSQLKRPHMLSPVSEVGGTNTKYIVLSSVASGNVQVLDTATKTIVGCIDLPDKANGSKASLHQAAISKDGSYFVGFDIGPVGRIFKVKISPTTDGKVDLTLVSTLELTDEKFPSVAQAKPICGVLNQQTNLFYVTLAGGGVIVFDANSDEIVVKHVYSKTVVPGIGCTVDYLGDGSMLSGGASLTGTNTIFHWPAPKSIDDFPAPKEYVLEKASDIHGTFTCETASESFVWVSKRLGGGFSVLSLKTGEISEIPLPLNNGVAVFPDVATYLRNGPGGGRAFVALRGPKPLTAINTYQESKRRAGWAVFDVTADCKQIKGGNVKYVDANPTIIPSGNPDIHGISLVWKAGDRSFAPVPPPAKKPVAAPCEAATTTTTAPATTAPATTAPATTAPATTAPATNFGYPLANFYGFGNSLPTYSYGAGFNYPLSSRFGGSTNLLSGYGGSAYYGSAFPAYNVGTTRAGGN